MDAVASVDLYQLQSRFGALHTSAITDVLDGMGFLQQALPPDITWLRLAMKLAGPAYPIEGRPRKHQDYDASLRRDVHTAPGDHVVADADGIVVVPQDVLLEVLDQAEAKVATESKIRDAVRAGTLPLEAYERFGTFY